MKYIKDLEAAGFKRDQAEAQVQMVLDAIEGDLATKADVTLLKEEMNHRFELVDRRFEVVEARIVNKLGLIVVSTTSIAVAILAWLIKI